MRFICTACLICTTLSPSRVFGNDTDAHLVSKTPQSIDIELTTHLGDDQTFVEGDILSFYLSLNHDAYVYVFLQDATGSVAQLYPNRHDSAHWFQAGLFLPLPNKASAFRYRAGAPFGKDIVWTFAVSKPLANPLKYAEAESLPATMDEIQKEFLSYAKKNQLAIGTTKLEIIVKQKGIAN
jgi:hypothetical protein